MINLSGYKIPHEPGCYMYKDSAGSLLYIGKAKDLHKRVSSYFRNKQGGKTEELVKRIAKIEFIEVRNEKEAWILEARLIRNHKPPFNIELKDAERLSWITISNDEFPRIFVTRNKRIKGKHFGPFTSAYHRNRLIEVIKRVYKLRSCIKMPKQPCLYFDIGMCSAPCISNISKENYQENVKSANHLLNGNVRELAENYKKGMTKASEDKNYEKAKEYRDNYLALESVLEKQVVETTVAYNQHVVIVDNSGTQAAVVVLKVQKGVIAQLQPFLFSRRESEHKSFFEDFLIRFYGSNQIPEELILPYHPEHEKLLEETLQALKKENQGSTQLAITVPQKGTKKELLQIAYKNAKTQLFSEHTALRELQDALSLNDLPRVIECFDISNLGDQFIVASMVQFKDGKANKSQYRRFKIKSVNFQDDFASMQEVVYRRYSRLLLEKKTLPDLIIIDGGPVQLKFACASLEKLNANIPSIGLAKEFEEIYTSPRAQPMNLGEKSRALQLLKQIRDEAHRFAVSYNRLLRKKEIRA